MPIPTTTIGGATFTARSNTPGLRLPDREAAVKTVFDFVESTRNAFHSDDPDSIVLAFDPAPFIITWDGDGEQAAVVASVTIFTPTFVEADIVSAGGLGGNVGVIQVLTCPTGEPVVDFDDDRSNVPDEE